MQFSEVLFGFFGGVPHQIARVDILQVLVVAAEQKVLPEFPLETGLKGEAGRIGHFVRAFTVVALGPGLEPGGPGKNFQPVQRGYAARQFQAVDFVFSGRGVEKESLTGIPWPYWL